MTSKRKVLIALLIIINVLVLSSIYIPPASSAISIFLAYFIPPLCLLNLALGCILFFTLSGPTRFLFSAALVLITIPFWNRTFQWRGKVSASDDSISLLSYNTKLFRDSDNYGKFSMESIEWVVKDTSAIKCIQEFSFNSNWPVLDVLAQVKSEGYEAHVISSKLLKFGKHNPGLAIFSKFPMVNKGVLNRSSEGFHGIIFADIVLESDTVRVYNVHLKSYHLNLEGGLTKAVGHVIDGIASIKSVVVDHTEELELLIEHAKSCRHPIIIAGDFNESPYSYNYGLLSHFTNAFEQKGSGFGFSMIKPPLYLRIDQVFSSPDIQIESFEEDYDMQISDHFPIRCSFVLAPNNY